MWGTSDVYNYGALENALLAKIIFPDWICRIYYSKNTNNKIINVLKSFDNVELILKNAPENDEINVTEHILGEDRKVWRCCQYWRFLPAFDKSVDIVIVRDIDARLCYKDKYAVDEWLASNKDFHILRDHSAHKRAIMGGLWGCRNSILCDDEIIEKYNSFPRVNNIIIDDQELLKKIRIPFV